MKILMLLTQDLESPSGLGRYYPLARQLAGLGHQVRIAALHSDYASINEKNYLSEGVEVQYVAQMHVMKKGSQKHFFLPIQLIITVVKATWMLSKSALEFPADLVFVGKPHPMNSIAAVLARLIRKTPTLVDCDDYEAGSGNFRNVWQRRIISFFEKRIPKFADVVTTNTKFMQEMLETWGVKPHQIYYLPNGVDLDRFTNIEADRVAIIRKEHHLEDKKVVGFIGSLSLINHPIYLLIQAFQIVHQVRPDSCLIFVGGGEDYHYMVQLSRDLGIQDDVIFIGRVPSNEVKYYYALCDVTVDPVINDHAARGRSPLKLFESWAAGIPFITGNVGDRRLLLGEPPAGIITEPGNPEALAEAIIRIFEDSELAVNFQRIGYERVREYSWEYLARQLNSALSKYAFYQ